ncbi:MAG: UTP--glucose-1-phosphate uridylyltransferase [Deltaproteobacteria bacterium]|nr:UTP--glucose-1-phosphate uridylyltransferase [Deltaproteobacteria bacterium]
MSRSPLIKQAFHPKSDDFFQIFRSFALKMEAHGMPAIVINVFKYYFDQLLSGYQGKLSEHDIEPIADEDIEHYEKLEEYREVGQDAMDMLAIVKLNGGSGTSMGLTKAKSLLPVRRGQTFLDIIVRQVEAMRERNGTTVPLLFMNSFSTHTDTMLALGDFDNGETRIPLAFLQHKFPKVLQKDYSPATWPQNPELEWNPPGHGDIFQAMVTSGVLQKLLKGGFKYAFISNSDNLGAVMDERILGYMVEKDLSFVMEVARRTHADRKGGHLARSRNDGRLVLREIAQCPEDEIEDFQDIERYSFFNTNSIWVDLQVLEKVFVYHGMMPLDIIVNKKHLDPRDETSPEVYQIERAMGSAIASFRDAAALEVPRARFAPVKTTNDILDVMSDNYIISDRFNVVPNPARTLPPIRIDLDPVYFKKIDEFQTRFPVGPPSLIECESLKVRGDVVFAGQMPLRGHVEIVNETSRQVLVTAEMLERADYHVRIE